MIVYTDLIFTSSCQTSMQTPLFTEVGFSKVPKPGRKSSHRPDTNYVGYSEERRTSVIYKRIEIQNQKVLTSHRSRSCYMFSHLLSQLRNLEFYLPRELLIVVLLVYTSLLLFLICFETYYYQH